MRASAIADPTEVRKTTVAMTCGAVMAHLRGCIALTMGPDGRGGGRGGGCGVG
ncbi:hypothetical protein MCBMB27_01354 [Methylobacterium phyllosphaerae]|uniref:Uncharacterized protein n=1 Tax=Methylobacterium phyllosphaerae TaxID=418223 RepID=A0AAE8HMR2_9HYPH|nr:hypothetical protein MCBMB27_01354 [Methylobacterium phyllosphaerae]SFG22563.1 hypothetical protein SAMN05192567_101139 [Methylobacterium phyllosphaerae]